MNIGDVHRAGAVRRLAEDKIYRRVMEMNNADLIVKTLKSAGINHGFGIPSGNVLPLMEAMRTGGIEFVLTAHELSLIHI